MGNRRIIDNICNITNQRSSSSEEKKKQYNTHGIAEIPAKGIGRLKGDFKYMGTMLKHPIDAIYYLKIGKRGSLLSAGIMIIVTFIIYMADILGRGFIFNQNSLSTLSPMLLSTIFFIILGLFIGVITWFPQLMMAKER